MSLSNLAMITGTVSYTHLDVYKRQLLTQLDSSADGIYKLTGEADSDLTQIQSVLQGSGDLLTAASERITDTTAKLDEMEQSGNFSELESLISGDRSSISTFLAVSYTHLDVYKRQPYAYTVDGGPEGEIQFENFNAASAEFAIHGVNVHPGEAKDIMVNSMKIAMELQSMLPEQEAPEHTEGYEGFFHLMEMNGSVEEMCIRDRYFRVEQITGGCI